MNPKTNLQKCHFIGIGGIGMSALAEILLSRNAKVSGSDQAKNAMTSLLSKKGADIVIGHSAIHIEPKSTVIFSSSVNANNLEYKAAVELQCKIMHRSCLLKDLMEGYRSLVVTGTHGKTTTTALLVKVLMMAKLDPSFAVGGISLDLKTNGYHGTGEYFVAEADESDGTFLKYLPFGAILTNIDFDHMDHFKTKENLIHSFETFCLGVTSEDHFFFCGDDATLLEISKKAKPNAISYGFSNHNQLWIKDYTQNGWESCFTIDFKGEIYKNITLSLIGKHNALNAAAVFGLCIQLNIDEKYIRKAFSSFKGVSRRSEKKGCISGVLLIDDYAHHPTEIQATLKAVREAVLEKKLIAVYQPHRYGRTKDILGTFKGAFDEVSEVIVTDIYASGEKPIDGISHENIVEELRALKIPCRYVPRQKISNDLLSNLFPHDVVVSLGAGDITNLADEIIARSEKMPIQKLKVGIFFGGRSNEHEVSIRSAKNVEISLNPEYYEPHFFGISKTGTFVYGTEFLEQEEIVNDAKRVISADVFAKIQECDLFFPVLHGPFGEDGAIQGFFETLNKPYVGCDFRASVVCMDKVITKQLMILNDVKTAPFVYFTNYQWKMDSENLLKRIEKELSFPLYVKPAHLGSSIGVAKVLCFDELKVRIDQALELDDKVLIENEIKGREIEFAVLGNNDPKVFHPGEILTNGSVYSYEAKYISEMKTNTKAELEHSIIERGLSLAKKAYCIACCQGLSRVDFFLDANNNYWLNEINTIPGFTRISLYPAICTANGLTAYELIDRLIVLCQDKHRNQK